MPAGGDLGFRLPSLLQSVLLGNSNESVQRRLALRDRGQRLPRKLDRRQLTALDLWCELGDRHQQIHASCAKSLAARLKARDWVDGGEVAVERAADVPHQLIQHGLDLIELFVGDVDVESFGCGFQHGERE